MPVDQRGRLQKELLGHLQHRLDLRLDAGFAGDLVGRLQDIGYLFDIGADKACEHPEGVGVGQADGGVQAFQLRGQLCRELLAAGFVSVLVLNHFT
ncbi:hypothetical protein D3C72_1890130 [compost metagenome]